MKPNKKRDLLGVTRKVSYFYRKSSVCKPSSVLDGYLSTPIVTEGLKRICRDAEQAFGLSSCTEWGLHARVVTKTCVGSYPAFPPLQLALRYISVALSLKSPSQDVILHSCSVVLGLSSWEVPTQPSGCLLQWYYMPVARFCQPKTPNRLFSDKITIFFTLDENLFCRLVADNHFQCDQFSLLFCDLSIYFAYVVGIFVHINCQTEFFLV